MGREGGQRVQVDDRERLRALDFATRVHRLRMLGLGFGSLCVASVLHFHGAHPGWWVLLALYAFAWPHLAYAIVKREPRPQQAELRNLLVDSAMGGLWVAVMQFSLLPSVLLVTMLSVDKLGVGGVRLLGWTSLVLVAACAGTSALLGFPLRFETPMSVIVGCLPSAA
jgi:diguanylate cyclase